MPANRFEIEMRNEAKRFKLSLPFFCKLCRQILKALGWKKAGLSVIFVDNRKMRRLNRQHLRHDWPTDVLAFSQRESRSRAKKFPGVEPSFLGDIVISVPTAKAQAGEYGNTLRQELCLYLCHGILHLMGYDDSTRRQRSRMEKKQKELLAKAGIRPLK